ncbi:MAG: hypothetical protein ACI9S8_000211 [Chlamydiales bacterium]|jgi:hypothetical protein
MSFTALGNSDISREISQVVDNENSRNQHNEAIPHTWRGHQIRNLTTGTLAHSHLLSSMPITQAFVSQHGLTIHLAQFVQNQDKENSKYLLNEKINPSEGTKLKISGIKKVATKLLLNFPALTLDKGPRDLLSKLPSIASIQTDELSDLETESSQEIVKDEDRDSQRNESSLQRPSSPAHRNETLGTLEVPSRVTGSDGIPPQFSETTREQLIDALISEYERTGALEFETLHEISLDISDNEQEIELFVPANANVFLEFESPPGSDTENSVRLAEDLGFEVIGYASDEDYEFVIAND